LTDKEPPQINEQGLAHFAVDVRYMAKIASELPEGDMDDIFEELSQVGFIFRA
jgi:exocyst complex component 6